ncbi:MAG TPA: 50S ribosomal protein L10 [Thermoleophilaceae bacterium]|nr:50S ribosomal protein L10 [Thermoleophilaceae bacterium]
MNRDEKAAVIDQVADQIQESQAIFALDYRGITVSQAAELRAKLREADASLRIVKNTLTELAADKAGAEDLKAFLDGPTAFTFVRGDAAQAAKALAAFRKEYELLEFKGGRMDGAAITSEEILAISKLPSRDALNQQLVGVLAYPIGGLARTLNQLIQGLAVQLGQIAEQGLVGGDAPEPEAAAPAEEAPAEDAPAEEASAEPAAEADTTEEAEAPAAEAADQDDTPAEGEDKES